MKWPEVIILGGGVAAIAMAHTLKWKLGLDSFTLSVVLGAMASLIHS